MKRLSALLLLTLAAGCATPPVQVVPARCPQLPEAPQILREPPPTLAAAELLFLVSLARMGTHEDDRPSRVTMKTPPSRRGDYEKFAGATIRAGKGNCVPFHRVDAHRLYSAETDKINVKKIRKIKRIFKYFIQR